MGRYISGETDYRNYLIEMEQQQDNKLDSVVTTIIEQFTSRAKMGKAKYGVDLDRTDLSLLEWIYHAKQ